MKRLKVGMIGLGEIAQIIHLPILQSMPERFEIVALCDVSPGLLALMGEKHRVEHLYESASEMLDQAEMNAVFVLNNMEFHTECTVAALKRNVHVFVEKPMCVTDREAEEIIRARRIECAGHGRLYAQIRACVYARARGSEGPGSDQLCASTRHDRAECFFSPGSRAFMCTGSAICSLGPSRIARIETQG